MDTLLAPHASFWGGVAWLAAWLVFDIAYNVVVGSGLRALGVRAHVPRSKVREMAYMPLPVLVLVIAFEELLFRMPLSELVSAPGAVPWMWLAVIGLLFGVVHAFGGTTPFLIALFCQGVGGIYYGLFFLKMGGMYGQAWHAFAWVCALHLGFNLWIRFKLQAALRRG